MECYLPLAIYKTEMLPWSGIGGGIVRIGGGDCSNSSGGGRVSGVGVTGKVGSTGGMTSWGEGVGGI